MKLQKLLKSFDACSEAIEESENYDSFEQAWNNWRRGDHMLWIAQKLDVDLRTLTLAKGYCANTVINLMKDKQSRNAVKMAIKYGKGLIELPELNAASAAAASAYTAVNAASAAATYAADAAAADAADAAADYAADAYAADAYAADAYAANVAHNAAYADAKIKNQKKTADICRKYLTVAVFEKINSLYKS